MFFTKEDEADLRRKGMTVGDLMQQIHQFTKDTKPVNLEKPCTPGDGISVLNPGERDRLYQLFEREKHNFSMIKFVPASGAASRMFKHLSNYSPENVADLTEEFILNFDRFPFIDALEKAMTRKNESLKDCIEKNDWAKIFDFILNPVGLHYDAQLKGLVIFHKYGNDTRTAFDEHLHEAASYAAQKDDRCRLHFTVAPQHLAVISQYVNDKITSFRDKKLEATYSVQDERTDTLALDKEDAPVRDEKGQLFFRPSGHGALIHNLGQLEADIIFIKNIDNVTTASQQEESFFYKKVLAGLLIELKKEGYRLLDQLDTNDKRATDETVEFIRKWFEPELPAGMNSEQLKRYAQLRLDRPIRVCGMVRNEGEPGGGPFWIRMEGGQLSKQIVEKSQVDPHDIRQVKILAAATHFNPVDIVCSIKKRNGENYDLEQFIDYSAGFISEKFHQGHVIKALELPGLWNGAMALWNTVFVEVPVSTFNPVKTVNDLLRPGHQ